jgi:hypothetical protein
VAKNQNIPVFEKNKNVIKSQNITVFEKNKNVTKSQNTMGCIIKSAINLISPKKRTHATKKPNTVSIYPPSLKMDYMNYIRKEQKCHMRS